MTTAVATRPKSALPAREPGSYTLAGFKRFCRHLKLDTGDWLKIHPFEETLLTDYFAGAVETVVILSKKNGKTTLMGALALFHLWCFADAEAVIGAASRDQATILFRQAAGLVRRSPDIKAAFDIRPGYREIRLWSVDNLGGRLRVLAADAATADGVIPTLALVDELHRHPSADLYGVFRDGLGPRNGRMITISTAGAHIDSPLGVLRAQAHRLEGFTRTGAYNYVLSADRSFAFHEWCLMPEDNPDDMELVKQANPAPWHTVAALQRRHDSPSTTPWQWKRFACGIWTEGEEPWLDPESWDRLADPIMTIPDGSDVFLGVDIGVAHDSTAIAVVCSGEKLRVKAIIIPPPAEGNVSLERVENELRRIANIYRVRMLAYDPWSFRRSAEILEADGLPVKDFPQSPERMSAASANLYRLIEAGELVHNGDPALRAHVMAGAVKTTGRGWRLDKDPRHPRAIDALIALVMAAQVATEVPPQLTPFVAWGS